MSWVSREIFYIQKLFGYCIYILKDTDQNDDIHIMLYLTYSGLILGNKRFECNFHQIVSFSQSL